MRALATAVLVALLTTTGCAQENPKPRPPAAAAAPQRKTLDWVETFGRPGARITFGVASFEVRADGWRARISITNGTAVTFSVADPRATLNRIFGVMLFRTGDLRELEQRNAAGELPSTRRADEFRPPLSLVLKPGATYTGTIGARGSLAAGRWVRIVFGALVPVGDPPPNFPPALVWITDHAYRLR